MLMLPLLIVDILLLLLMIETIGIIVVIGSRPERGRLDCEVMR